MSRHSTRRSGERSACSRPAARRAKRRPRRSWPDAGARPRIMAIDNLRSFLDELERQGELVRIREPLKVHLEIAEVADRVMKQPDGGKALLFERPVLDDGTTSDVPVAINTFGSWKRIALALGVNDV